MLSNIMIWVNSRSKKNLYTETAWDLENPKNNIHIIAKYIHSWSNSLCLTLIQISFSGEGEATEGAIFHLN